MANACTEALKWLQEAQVQMLYDYLALGGLQAQTLPYQPAPIYTDAPPAVLKAAGVKFPSAEAWLRKRVDEICWKGSE